MTDEKLYLAIDQGGHASRAMVFDSRGGQIAGSSRPLATKRPRKNFVEHHPGKLLRSVSEAVAEVLSSLGDRARAVEAAGMAVQRSSIVCWDRVTGEALSPVISWQDTRGRDTIASLRPMSEWVHRKTGLFPSSHYGASKIRWCLEKIPGLKGRARDGRLCIGPLSSYLVSHLAAGNPVVSDPVCASRTLLWNIYSRNWDDELMDMFSIPGQVLPACVPSRHSFGPLEVGGFSIPLEVVTGDQSAALYAHGPLDPETAYVNMGTGAFVSRSTGSVLFSARRLLSSVLHLDVDEAVYVLEGTVNGAGSALAWASEELKLPGLEGKLADILGSTSPEVLFLNGVSGLGAPFWLPDFGSAFVGEGSPEEKAAAVAESIVFLLRANGEEMEKTADRPGKIVVSGGLSRADGLCRRLADLFQVPVHRPDTREATALGTCYLAADRPENWQPSADSDLFEPADDPGVRDRYLRWEEAMLIRMRDAKPT